MRTGASGRRQTMRRVVIAVDPSGGSGRGNDETGIIVAGLGEDGHVYMLGDASGKMSPDSWARRAVDAYRTARS